MAFPLDQDLELTARAAFGADLTAEPITWEWTDLSDRVIDTLITISRGVLVGTGTAKTGSGNGLTLLNDDGWLTPYLATSPYHPYVDAGTPFDLAIRTNTTPHITDTFTRTVASGWGTPDSGPNWTNTTGLSVAGGNGLITFSAANQSFRARTLQSLRDTDIRFDASVPAVALTSNIWIGPELRDSLAGTESLRPTLEFTTGGNIKLFPGLLTLAGIVIPTNVTVAGLTYTGGTVISCHFRIFGDRLYGRAWLASDPEPTVWHLSYAIDGYTDPGFHVNMIGTVLAGNTNTFPFAISVDNVTVQQPPYPRFEGYIADVQPAFRPISDGTTHSVAVIKLGGVGTILERRESPAWSPLRRSIQLSTSPPIAYWPGEDKEGATSAASAFEDQPAMVVTGPAVFDFDLGVGTDDALIARYGTTGVVSLAAGARLSAPVPVTTSAAWTVAMMHQSFTVGVGGGVTEMRLMEWATPTGTHQRWALVGTLTGHVIRAYNDVAGTTTNVVTYANVFNTFFNHAVCATQNGGNIDVSLRFNDTTVATGSVAGTIGAPNRITINPDQTNTTASTSPFGIRFLTDHITVHDAFVQPLPFYLDSDTGQTVRADRGWAYEAAHRRALRLAGEADVPLRVIGDPYDTGITQLNSQQPGGTVTLLKQAIDAESGGLLLEAEFGWLHIPRTTRYNRSPDLTVDMSEYCYSDGTDPDQVLVPQLDPRAPNRWTVQRTGGSSAIYAAPASYRIRRGTIDAQAELDVLDDTDTPQHAAWRTHLSVDGAGANYPTATLDLAANPDLIDDWVVCQVGARVQRTNQPTIAGLGVIEHGVDGITETIGRRTWTASLDTSPGDVWDTGVYDGDVRYDSRSTTLAADVTDSATTLGFSTTDKGDLWTITSSPFDVTCAGQTDAVLWMSGVGSIATLDGGLETGLTGWTASGTTTPGAQSSAQAHTGVYSAMVTVTGSPATVTFNNSTMWPAIAATAYTGTAWIYSAAGLSNVRVAMSWYNASTVFISSSNGPTVSIPAGWTQLTVAGTSPALTGFARIVPTLLSSPANGTVVHLDDLDITLDSALTGVGPYVQNAWVTRDPIVVKALSAGEPIRIANPARWAL